MEVVEPQRSRSAGANPASRLAIVGFILALAGGAVTLGGQISTYGGPLPGFLVIETVIMLILLLGVVALSGAGGRRRVVGVAIAALAGLGMLITAVGMIGELMMGAAPSWIPLDCAITAADGMAWAAAAAMGWRRRHQW